jgi:hypothetical protein
VATRILACSPSRSAPPNSRTPNWPRHVRCGSPGTTKPSPLAASTRYYLGTLTSRQRAEHTLELLYSLWFLDAIAADHLDLVEHIRRLTAVIPPDGLFHVDGGLEDEFMRSLDFARCRVGP